MTCKNNLPVTNRPTQNYRRAQPGVLMPLTQVGPPGTQRIARNTLSSEHVIVKEVGPLRVAELTASVDSYGRQDIEPTLQLLYPELSRRLAAAGVRQAASPAIAYYEDPAEPSDEVIVHAALPISGYSRPGRGFAIVNLTPIRRAATIIHRGTTGDLTQSLLILAGWIEDHRYRPVGYHRELYLGPSGDLGPSLVELQAPVAGPRPELDGGRAAHPAAARAGRRRSLARTRASSSANW